ncbi:radical SAM domain-containing protein [Desulfonema limicola]|uniref:Radical SAM domain-containing protein n=1 Tax=Desulfonema limicola TaxID=45656 RepID=A0A975B620_9BACT|nr:hypothetical protein [Desulfonema limicola]QTA79434.1 radical SAM domain-containing protein [Desulfonema limicola]
MRNILLLEPNYKNKYPPIGLMKIATYHRMLNDNVTFYKGDMEQFVISNIVDELLFKLHKIDKTIIFDNKKPMLIGYIKTGKLHLLEELLPNSAFNPTIKKWLIYYKDYYRKKLYVNKPKWDRIYITTLFTFHWKKTIETINFAKNLVKDIKQIKIGGVLATVLADEVEKETGIVTHQGLLNKAGIFDDNNLVIDELPLDYSILDEIDYKYPENNAYYGYMTRGCKRKCSFCAVWKIEPKFNHFISFVDKYKYIKENFGDQRNLLLLDNNVLASKRFPDIIDEIKKCGFTKDATFIEPNHLDIAIKNLEKGINDKAYIKKSFEQIHYLLNKLKNKSQQDLYNLLDEYKLLEKHTTTKQNLLKVYQYIKDIYEKHRNKISKHRYVDFNQGVDARLINEENIKLLSGIPIKPLRIAFDSMKYEDVYVKAVTLAKEHGITHLSNYLLYNEKDRPIELYQRLKINIMLCDTLKINIYSFPMKYHPINGDNHLNRDYLGQFWNRKFIRAVQTVLNATKGKIGIGKSFFYKAFGKNQDEFIKILYMPEPYILYRYFFEERGYTDKWWNEFDSFNISDKKKVKRIIEANEFNNFSFNPNNKTIVNFINTHYKISRDINDPKSKFYEEKQEYDKSKSKNI